VLLGKKEIPGVSDFRFERGESQKNEREMKKAGAFSKVLSGKACKVQKLRRATAPLGFEIQLEGWWVQLVGRTEIVEAPLPGQWVWRQSARTEQIWETWFASPDRNKALKSQAQERRKRKDAFRGSGCLHHREGSQTLRMGLLKDKATSFKRRKFFR
jgi:hypothetical protein